MANFFTKRAKKNFTKRLDNLVYLFDGHSEVGALATPLREAADKLAGYNGDLTYRQRKDLNEILQSLENSNDIFEVEYLEYYKWVVNNRLSLAVVGRRRNIDKKREFYIETAEKYNSLATALSDQSAAVALKLVEAEANKSSFQFQNLFVQLNGLQSRMIDAAKASMMYATKLSDEKLISQIKKQYIDNLKFIKLDKDENGERTLEMLTANERFQKEQARKSKRLHEKTDRGAMTEEQIFDNILSFNSSEQGKAAMKELQEKSLHKMESNE